MSSAPRDPEELEAAGRMDGGPVLAEIPAATRSGAVHLTVADLDRSVRFYERAIGLVLRERLDGRAHLGTDRGEDLLVLVEQPGARPARRHCGLYHFALLLPARADLARWLAHAVRERVPLTGFADHFVSEAIYLDDPDEHGIEIYWDRPRETWEGQVSQRMTTLPLDVDGLLGELDDPPREPFERLAPDAVMGHVHLRVADISRTIAFYRDLLGFGLMARLGDQAAFLSAGGYHHHLGANTWQSAGAGQPPPGTASLQAFTIVVPSVASRDALAARAAGGGHTPEPVDEGLLVRDPSGNRVLLAVVDERR
ncbi:MAG TPA: VOC family protein [Solirubrobacteraceae bacterium]|nr:VOC family protein [Solirubrobacteraceae bacterium]